MSHSVLPNHPLLAPGELDGVPLRHRLATGQVRLHLVEAGPAEGPPVLLLHGFPDGWWAWRRQVAPLARAGFRVLAPSQRGYGLSDKPGTAAAYRLDLLADDVCTLLSSLGLQRVAVVGHDWGGILGWWLALTRTSSVRRLVIVNAPHPAVFARTLRTRPVQVARSWYAGFFQLPLLPEALLRAIDYALLWRAVRLSSHPDTFGPHDRDVLRAAWSQAGALTGMLNWYRANLQLTRGAPADPRVRVPTQVLWGAQDVALLAEMAEPSARLCEGGRLLLFPDASHWVQVDEAERVNAALIEFLTAGA